MTTSPIDLSSGLVPKANSGAAPIDLSSGLVPKQAPQPEITYQQPPAVATSPDPDWLKTHGYAHYGDTDPQQAVDRYNSRGFLDKAADVLQMPMDYMVGHTENAINAAKAGQYAKSANEGIKAGSMLAAPLIPQSIAAAPLATAVGIGTGVVGQKVGQVGAKALGATDDQAELAGNITGLAGGLATSKLGPGLMSRVSPDVSAKASAFGSLAKDDAISHIPLLGRLVRRPSFVDYADALKTTADPQLDLFNSSPKLGDSPLFSTNPDAAPVKFNGAQPPQSPLKQLAAGPIVTPPPADTSGSIPYTPPPVAATTRAQRLGLMLPEKASGPIELGPGELLSPDSPEGLLPAAPRFLVDKSGNPRVQFLTSPATDQVAAPSTKADSAQALFQGTAAGKPSLLDGIRDHEFLSKTQNELEGQEGDDEAQAKLQGWMAAHNQQAPGAKPGPGLMNRAALSDIEQANAQGKAVLPPEQPQASPGLMARAKGGKGGPPSPAQATPAAQRVQPPVAAAQPQLATEDNMEQLLADSLAQQRAKKGPGLMQNAQPAPSVDNRGQYPDLRAELDKMAPEDQQRAIFMNDKTDLPNRRAFDIAQQNSSSPAVAMSDSDGLKAFNDKFGYAAGNALLKAKADALREAGVEAYHDKGDEFMARGSSTPEDLKAKLDQANEILKNKVIHVETNDGQALKFTGAQFTSGAGENLGTAETQLKINKAAREAAGERKRGELGTIKQVK